MARLLEVEIEGPPILINVSGNYGQGDPCAVYSLQGDCIAVFECGWTGLNECASCSGIPVEFCEGTNGCTWNVDHCEGEQI